MSDKSLCHQSSSKSIKYFKTSQRLPTTKRISISNSKIITMKNRPKSKRHLIISTRPYSIRSNPSTSRGSHKKKRDTLTSNNKIISSNPNRRCFQSSLTVAPELKPRSRKRGNPWCTTHPPCKKPKKLKILMQSMKNPLKNFVTALKKYRETWSFGISKISLKQSVSYSYSIPSSTGTIESSTFVSSKWGR